MKVRITDSKDLLSLLAKAAAILVFIQWTSQTYASERNRVSDEVVNGLAEMIDLSRDKGEVLWPGFGKVPYGFLLVEAEREILLCDGRLPVGFVKQKDNAILSCPQAVGPTSWRKPNFLAAMPVFGPPSVIVMGTPVTTGKTISEWKITILHEHFHQWQSAQQDYYQRVDALNLSDGDTTGMWMLNYPFPYENEAVDLAHQRAAKALLSAVQATESQLAGKLRSYLAARRDLQKLVSEKDWRYFEFQLWQEGVARWTEFTLGMMSDDMQVRAAAVIQRQRTLDALAQPSLKADGRIAVYALGAGEAMLLERVNSHWRRCYNDDFTLGSKFIKQCDYSF